MKVGYELITADKVLSKSGEPVAIYGYHIISGATAGVVKFREGTLVSDTITLTETGTVTTGKTVSFGGVGVVFPTGCFVDIDANVTSVAVFFDRIK